MYETYAALLKKCGVTSYQVAKATGISQVSLSDWKHGRCTPKMDKLLKIARYFDVPLEFFVSEQESGGEPHEAQS